MIISCTSALQQYNLLPAIRVANCTFIVWNHTSETSHVPQRGFQKPQFVPLLSTTILGNIVFSIHSCTCTTETLFKDANYNGYYDNQIAGEIRWFRNSAMLQVQPSDSTTAAVAYSLKKCARSLGEIVRCPIWVSRVGSSTNTVIFHQSQCIV